MKTQLNIADYAAMMLELLLGLEPEDLAPWEPYVVSELKSEPVNSLVLAGDDPARALCDRCLAEFLLLYGSIVAAHRTQQTCVVVLRYNYDFWLVRLCPRRERFWICEFDKSWVVATAAIGNADMHVGV